MFPLIPSLVLFLLGDFGCAGPWQQSKTAIADISGLLPYKGFERRINTRLNLHYRREKLLLLAESGAPVCAQGDW